MHTLSESIRSSRFSNIQDSSGLYRGSTAIEKKTHPHAPTRASAHTPACTREGPELKLEAETPAKPKAKQMSAADDAEWLAQLAQNPGYRGVDLAAELGRMQAWCQLKGKQPSRSRFLNWINRADRNLAPQRGNPPRRAFDQSRMMEGLTAEQIGTL